MDKGERIAIIGIALNNRDLSGEVNRILSDYAHIIVSRMGLPYKEKSISVISLIVDGTNDEIGALSGKLGSIVGVKTKVAMMF